MEDYLLSAGVAILLMALKNPQKKKSIRNIALKVFKSLKAAYSGDPDFQ